DATAAAPQDAADDSALPVDPRHAEFNARFARTEAQLLALLQGKAAPGLGSDERDSRAAGDRGALQNGDSGAHKAAVAPARKPARAIDEDDYGDDDDDDDDEDEDTKMEDAPEEPAQVQQDAAGAVAQEGQGQGQGAEADGPPQLTAAAAAEEEQITEASAKRKFRDYFFTLENDRDAMLEQQRLDAMEAQIEAETSGQPPTNGTVNNATGPSVESLSSTNLGATSLVMKNLFRRIDEKRNQIKATDAEIRNIIRDVRKGRSKWASDEKVNQEELYEAAEQVLNSLKAETEYAGPFLQKVNKRDAPDYYQIIKQPMDIGSMFKKLKYMNYKSKKDFVDDLNLIWANCLKYNADPTHFLRKKALYMRKRSEELLQHVPDVAVIDRAAYEAEERRKQKFEIGLDGEEDSDDEEPIMASRGRKAPQKGTTARKQQPAQSDGTPAPETKPALGHSASTTALRNDFLRPDSEAPMENGLATPPPGSVTPLGPLGIPGSAAHGSQADVSEMDVVVDEAAHGPSDEITVDDPELKIWKRATKKGRARVAMARHRLFRGDKLNPEEAALLRNKAGMRRWLRHQMDSLEGTAGAEDDAEQKEGAKAITGETIAEGLEEEEEGYLPDYYDTLSAIPDLEERLKWVDDSEGHATALVEETLRIVPPGSFVSPESVLTKKMDANMHQMQETRKLCAKIGIVKQMQLQSQVSAVPIFHIGLG
ncbi:MAG: hypothetical protein INR71_02470, partial [Terriglobus roseus]|nr:hypothetical protein [Terriglobus roseus]